MSEQVLNGRTRTADMSRSAYPATVDDLMPRALELAERIGEVPSLRRLIHDLRIGAPKARAVAARIAELRGRAGLSGDDEVMAAAIAYANDTAPDTAQAAPDTVDTDRATAADDAPEPVSGAATAADASPVEATAPATEPGELAPAVTQPQVPADTPPGAGAVRRPVAWPVLLLAAPAFVAIWAGWVDLGRLTGFGPVNLLPGITDRAVINTAITLPIGMETYAAYALWVWSSGRAPRKARRFAGWSTIGALVMGAAGQVTYHLMTAAGWTAAPWPVTALVSCLPVAVLGMGAALAHLLHTDGGER